MADRKLTQLAGPDAAIASYLDELLHTATDTALRDEPEPPKPVVRERKRVAPPPPVQETRAADIPSPPEPEPEPEPPGRPEWSDRPFECLIFTVAGLQLAVPLILLGAIHRIEEPVKPIPGSPRWYMGMRPDRDHNLRVVDTAEWIMAGRAPANARDNYRFVIRLDSSEWGLACDDVAQSFTLKPDEVRWRTARSKRPWLAGTVIDHMCALIDVQTMANLLVRAEREQHLDLS
ncbi:chemotaxis protein CheW [Marinobacter sp. HL-58]|uniref:chemotaxis protein CheW n=1 Tax=Marinobacter sp. HL-58 TaxID=1479237 RepID=UPI0004884F70|nr:chemotaxis protein CheW [Marinobacter sp. HL-58]KPQ02470.1 MAG: chemotaxis signal relay system purine-binding protiein CheW [Marinobacter sp. HL-58]